MSADDKSARQYGDAFEFWWAAAGLAHACKPEAWEAWKASARRPDDSFPSPIAPMDAQWCMDAFWRVNPGRNATVPSLYLLAFAREVLRVYGARPSATLPPQDRLIALAAELANENERLRGVLGSLLNEKGSVQYPAQHERVVAARKALEVAAVPLSDITNEMRQAAWTKFTSADVPYSAIYAVMHMARTDEGTSK